MAEPNQQQDPSKQPGTTPPTPLPIDKDLANLEEETWNQNVLEGLKSELGPIKQKKDQAVKNYDGKKFDQLMGRWDAQWTALVRLWNDINDYSDWLDIITRFVCPTKDKIKEQSDIVSGLAPPQGKRQKKVTEAKAKVEEKKAELEGWLAIDQQLSKQLDEVDKAIKDVKDAYNGPHPVISIYLFWFKALPLHQSIAPKALDARIEPTFKVEKFPSCLKWPPQRGSLYLIATEDLPKQIDEAWHEYRTAREQLAAAERAFKKPDDLAAESRTLVKLRQSEDQDIKDALANANLKPQNPPAAQAAP